MIYINKHQSINLVSLLLQKFIFPQIKLPNSLKCHAIIKPVAKTDLAHSSNSVNSPKNLHQTLEPSSKLPQVLFYS